MKNTQAKYEGYGEKRKHRVAFISHDLYSFFSQTSAKSFGGVSRIYNIVKHLSYRGRFNVYCLVGSYGQAEEVLKDGLTLIRCPSRKPHHAAFIIHRLLGLRPDLIIEFYASSRLGFLAGLSKLIGKKLIFFTGSDIDVNGGYRVLTNPLFYRLYVWGLRHADRIICQTERQAILLRRNYGLKGEVILSPYVRITDPLRAAREFVLWVGRSNAYKRPDLFLDLAEAVPSEKFVMICNPGRQGRDMYEEVNRRAAGMPNVTFIPAVQPREIAKFYAGAKWLLNTSDFEGFPNTFIEAALQKTPIVSLHVDPNGMLSNFEAGVCCKGSFSEMLDRCEELAANRGKRNEMGKKARKYAEDYHDIDQAMEKIVRVFELVMETNT